VPDDAIKDSTTKQAGGEGLPAFGPDTIEGTMRARVRETIEAIVKEELEFIHQVVWRPLKTVRVVAKREVYLARKRVLKSFLVWNWYATRFRSSSSRAFNA
jgi:hypothetical protein